MITSEISRDFMAHWMSIVVKVGKPTIKHFDPVDISPKILPHVFITHLEENPFQVKIGLQGTFINDRVGQNLSGEYITKNSFGENYKNIMDIYERIAKDGVCMATHERITSAGGAEIIIEVLHLPVWDSDGQVSNVIGAIDIIKKPGGLFEEFKATVWHVEENNIIPNAPG